MHTFHGSVKCVHSNGLCRASNWMADIIPDEIKEKIRNEPSVEERIDSSVYRYVYGGTRIEELEDDLDRLKEEEFWVKFREEEYRKSKDKRAELDKQLEEGLERPSQPPLNLTQYDIDRHYRSMAYITGQGTLTELQRDLDTLRDREAFQKHVEYMAQQKESFKVDEDLES